MSGAQRGPGPGVVRGLSVLGTLSDWKPEIRWDGDQVAKLIEVAEHAKVVMNTLHEGFREEIDFIPLWRSLIELGLMPYNPADWDDDITGPAPKIDTPATPQRFMPPEPCPLCGRSDMYDINWVDVGMEAAMHTMIPGTITCTNPDCPSNNQEGNPT